MTDMPTRPLGRHSPHVSALGLGCNGLIHTGEDAERETVRTIQAALDAGFTLLDTADFYGSGVSEMLVGRAIRDRRDHLDLSRLRS